MADLCFALVFVDILILVRVRRAVQFAHIQSEYFLYATLIPDPDNLWRVQVGSGVINHIIVDTMASSGLWPPRLIPRLRNTQVVRRQRPVVLLVLQLAVEA